VVLERGSLRLVSTTEELFGRNSSCSGLENREHAHWDPSRWSRGTLCPQMLAITSPTSGDRLVGIVRSRTRATECFFISKKVGVSSSEALIFIHVQETARDHIE
jgi:hypothetical protein